MDSDPEMEDKENVNPLKDKNKRPLTFFECIDQHVAVETFQEVFTWDLDKHRHMPVEERIKKWNANSVNTNI